MSLVLYERRDLRRVALIVLVALAWFLLAKGCKAWVDPPPKVEWRASSSQAPPPAFLIVGFPVQAPLQTFDAPGGTLVGELNRAVSMTPLEESGTWVQTEGVYVRRADLTLTPPAEPQVWLAGLLPVLRKSANPSPNGIRMGDSDLPGTVTFVQSFGRDERHSRYSIVNGRAVPVHLARDQWEEGLVVLLRGVVGFGGTLVLGLIVTVALWRVLLPRAAREPVRDSL
ncbi:MAG TPA: hypothetical protein VD997_02850 [Phycisphaerales bacterium]|nr:hypothetical protein [Phycisphaerales bacterium]